jgi:murein DD-endopeptidase MepM/ murein hydrolase activator NlpD
VTHNRPSKLPRLALSILVLTVLVSPPALALSQTQQSEDPPFQLPFLVPPGPDTWLVFQAYGHTLRAYQQRNKMYRAGQGLHFGVDFYARCGLPVAAIGDGVVAKVDAKEHGAGPHNLLIDHPNGYASLYGHLLEIPSLIVGQTVRQGDIIGKVGDPEETCLTRSHLHLEIRNAGRYGRAYNPPPLIAADWEALALHSASSLGFARDLDQPRQNQSLHLQPEVNFWGPSLNDYTQPWPLDWNP